MLIPPGVRVFLALQPVDMRASFYRLATHVRAALEADPKNGHLYLFLNQRKNLVKVLFWDRSGFCVFSKKLEAGRFILPVSLAAGTAKHEIDFATLTLLLEGFDLRHAPRQPAYEPPKLK